MLRISAQSGGLSGLLALREALLSVSGGVKRSFLRLEGGRYSSCLKSRAATRRASALAVVEV